MDGIELCKRIKQDIRISHIPVILLTALSTVQDKISGMQSGAEGAEQSSIDQASKIPPRQ